MIALRQIQDVKANKLVLELPSEFKAQRVEVIILPAGDASSSPEKLRNILLSAPILSTKDILPFKQNRKWIEEWNVKKF